jgi:hypothetical protein
MPLTDTNDRIAGHLQALLVKERVTTQSGGSDSPSTAVVLKGVQSVGVSKSLERNVFQDIGRMQNQYGSYNKTTYSINVSRVLSEGEDFFYNTSGLTSYEDSHILSNNTSQTIGFNGINNRLKNYDLVLVYGTDTASYIGADLSEQKLMSTNYRCCVLTGISYTIPIQGPITEDLTFTTHTYTQDDITTVGGFSNLNFPHTNESIISRKDIITSDCIYPLEVNKAFNNGDTLKGISVLGLQQIEFSVEIAYRDIPDIGKWRGSSGDRAEQNLFKQVEIPVAVSCTFSGIVRGQYFVDTAQDHEVTDTHHTAGTYGAENKGSDNYKADREIRVVAQGSGSNKFQWNMGQNNYITSFDITGGDAGGSSNVEASMSFQNDHSEIFFIKDSTLRSFSSSTV